MARHEILRTTFAGSEHEPKQLIGPVEAGFVLREQELTSDVSLDELARSEMLEPFDLRKGPLVRGRLVRVSEEEHVLLITQHRIVADRSSVTVFMRELLALYDAFTLGRSDPLPLMEWQYADHALLQEGEIGAETLKHQLEFWVRNLAGTPELIQLPIDGRRSPARSHPCERLQVSLSTSLTDGLRNLARQHSVTLFATLLSGWAVLLSRWSGQDEVVIGTTLANRHDPRTESLLGPLENAALLRVGLQEDPTIEQLLKQVKNTMAETAARQDVPFEDVIAALEAERGGGPLLQVAFQLEQALHATAGGELEVSGLRVTQLPLESATTHLELLLTLVEEQRGLTGTLAYAGDLFERATVERMVESWSVLLEAIVADAHRPVSRLPMLSAAQREQVLYGFNKTEAAYPHDRLIHELFEEQVARTPDAVAVVYERASFTYEELNRRANRLARYLKEQGVGPDQLVALCVERSLEMVIGILAVLKAGGAYVPLDPAYPAERLTYMLADAAPRILLTQEHLRALLPAATLEVIAIDAHSRAWAEQNDANLPSAAMGLTPDHLAYVIYTSGSTGTPKGAMNEHRGMVNRVVAQRDIEALSDEDICCQKTSISFVDAVFETLGALCNGRPLVIIPAAAVTNSREMAALIARERVTQLITVPSLARSMLEDAQVMRDLSGLRSWTLSGEEVRADLLMKLHLQLPDCEFITLYGASEVSSDAAFYKTRRFEGERVPIGRPVANIRVYVLDRHGEPVPTGVAGEICVAGVGVGRGYLNKPGLTATRFLRDPFDATPNGRLYKTGDLGRWRADGMLEYLGRNDHQVKIRGFRIELGEIEAQLLRHACVREAVVVAREDTLGDKRLVAYVALRDDKLVNTATSCSSGRPLILDALRSHLCAVLPEYMVPAACVILENLPRTPNGKLDRRALPRPELDAYATRDYEPPRGEIEQALAGMWQQLLRLERVGRNDNFFELGGHSLLIVQMMEGLRRAGLSAEARDIFSSRSLAALARTLRADTREQKVDVPPNVIPAGCEEITPQMLPLVELEADDIARIVQAVPGGALNVQDIYPLTPLQEGMLFHHLLDAHGGDTYVEATLLSLPSRERLEELIAALQGVIDRHEILRTTILWENLPRPVQVVHRAATLPVEEVDLAWERDLTQQIQEWLRPERQRLDLRQAPLMKVQIAMNARRAQWYALLQVHHLVDDAASLKVLISEVVAHLEGRASELPEPVSYRNHVAQALAYARTQDAPAFFRSKLADIDEPTSPFGLHDVHGDGARIEETRQEVELALARRARAQARRLSVSVATLFHAAWSLVVACTSGRDDVVFGSVLLGRLQGTAGAKQTVGMFVNTLPLRLRVADVTARELVERTQQELVELLAHEQASLAMAQRCSGLATSTPLFNTVLNYRHGAVDPATEWAGAAGIRVLANQERTNYPITVSVDDLGEGFAVTAQTDRRIDPRCVAAYLHTALEHLVEALERAPQTSALALPILPERERFQVLHAFNDTERPYPQNALIQDLFEERVLTTPHAVALIGEGEHLTYAELNEQANHLAHYLIRQGVRVGECIPILMSRCLRMLVAQLAVLKSGAAYVPVDPKLPEERQVFIFEDCGARRVIAEGPAPPRLSRSLQWIDCAALADVLVDMPAQNPGLRLTGPAAAYVMYTSGSTGMPKGVVVPHRAVNRLVINNGYALIEPTDRIAHCSSPAFDASTFEIWAGLLNGASVFVIPQSVVLEGQQFAQALRNHRVTVLWLTVGLFTQYADTLAEVLPQLKYLLVGGDVVEPRTVRRVLQNNPPRHLLNGYGPTECTTFSATYLIESVEEDTKAIPIGRPISNTRIYILDRRLQPVPVGVAGELYIGGSGVALGYLNRPSLTAERFIPDLFSADPDARLYKSGDLGRWRPDGTIEFLGRNDQQVKLRGFRIELGEIEAQLLQNSYVKEAVVMAREDDPGEKRLVAYIVADVQKLRSLTQAASDDAGVEIVDQWKRLYEETYSAGPAAPSFVGWNSSYTGQPIPVPQMQEWLNCTLERIRALQPKRVLEVGCGVGLLLQHVAPQCEVYVGTDFSASALEKLRRWMSHRADLAHVQLLQRSATELEDLNEGSFDTVVLNSVVQYFPDVEYLIAVLQGAVRLLRPGGRIFVGDVRNLHLLTTFYSAVQLGKAAATVTAGQLRRRIARAVSQDKELVIDPQLFQELPTRMPGIRGAEVHLKRGRAPNELTRYRYDVVLRTAEQSGAGVHSESLDWAAALGSLVKLEALLSERCLNPVRVTSIPNGRLARDAAAQRLIETGDEQVEASALRRQLNELQFDEVEPETFWQLGQSYGYDVQVSWGAEGSPACFDVQFLDPARAEQQMQPMPLLKSVHKPWSAYANDPLESSFRQQLIPQLRDYLKGRLPEYMVPSAWVTVKQLPLTANGKVDRRALPAPQSRPEEMGEYVAPRTDLERTLAEIWAKVLRVDQVGVHDNFFELGGHSLLATSVITHIRRVVDVDIPLRVLFEKPTIEGLSHSVLQEIAAEVAMEAP